MASRVGLSPKEYESFVSGTKFLTSGEAKKHFAMGDGFDSLYGSTKIADDFNVANEVYKEPQDVGSYIDASITNEM
jgi:NitT/TauT family transport system substrate-binding protein